MRLRQGNVLNAPAFFFPKRTHIRVCMLYRMMLRGFPEENWKSAAYARAVYPLKKRLALSCIFHAQQCCRTLIMLLENLA